MTSKSPLNSAASGSPPFGPSRAVLLLSLLVAALAALAAGAGLLLTAGEGPGTFASVHGVAVELYGRGLYRHDSLLAGAGHKGTDFVTLALAVPLLLGSTLLYRRGSLRGGLLHLGALAWFVYAYASFALGAAAYNELFLVYVALFSASLFALILAFRSFDPEALRALTAPSAPRLGLALFLIASGLLTLAVWLVAPVAALLGGGPPDHLDGYTTLFTTAIDIAVIVPTALLAATLVRRREPLGHLIAFPLLVLEAMLAPMIVAQTASQVWAGVSLSTAEVAGPVLGFLVIALSASWFVAAALRRIPGSGPRPEARSRPAAGSTRARKAAP